MANGEYKNPYQDKIDKEKNIVKLRSGTANQQLMNAAYLGVRQEPPAVMTWMNAAKTGFASFTEAIDESKKARQTEIDGMNASIDDQIGTLTTVGFELGKPYYNAANTYTKRLREKYLAAEGNPELQNEIKMELNIASQSITGTRDAIKEIATAWGTDEDESTLERSGLNPKQRNIIQTVTNDANAIWDYEKNTFVWKDPKSGEIYTTKDIQDIQKLASRDYVGKEKYIKDEQAEEPSGLMFKQGIAGSKIFNKEAKMLFNENRVTKENINFYINGDFTNDGTPSFKEELKKHPDFDLTKEDNVIFRALTKSGKYPDRSGSPEGFDLTDMPDPTPGDGVYTEGDLEKLRNDVYNAVTDETADGYDFNISKKLIAEYMTLRQNKAFYKGSNVDANGNPNLTPEQFAASIGNDNFRDEDFTDAGGNIGYMKSIGWKKIEQFQDKKKKKPYNPKQYKWEIIPSGSFDSGNAVPSRK